MVNLFKRIPEHEQAEYRQWARDNYKPFSEIKGIWHPIVQAECVRMNEETGYAPDALRGEWKCDCGQWNVMDDDLCSRCSVGARVFQPVRLTMRDTFK